MEKVTESFLLSEKKLHAYLFQKVIVIWNFLTNTRMKHRSDYSIYLVEVLWGQPIKLAQLASELCENKRNNLLFFEIVPCHFCGASEVQT